MPFSFKDLIISVTTGRQGILSLFLSAYLLQLLHATPRTEFLAGTSIPAFEMTDQFGQDYPLRPDVKILVVIKSSKFKNIMNEVMQGRDQKYLNLQRIEILINRDSDLTGYNSEITETLNNINYRVHISKSREFPVPYPGRFVAAYVFKIDNRKIVSVSECKDSNCLSLAMFNTPCSTAKQSSNSHTTIPIQGGCSL